MDAQRAEQFIMANRKNFSMANMQEIRNSIENANQVEWQQIQLIEFRDPTFMLIISILIGGFGVDRMLIGQIGLGVAKLLTCGGFGVWSIVDWFLIMDATKEYNYHKFKEAIYGGRNGGFNAQSHTSDNDSPDDSSEQKKLDL